MMLACSKYGQSKIYIGALFHFSTEFSAVVQIRNPENIFIYQSFIFQLKLMEPENNEAVKIVDIRPKAAKQLLRNIESTDRFNYITTPSQKLALNYPQNCISNNFTKQQLQKNSKGQLYLLGIDCQMVRTVEGFQICLIVIVDENNKLLYKRWFRPDKKEVIDYMTSITNISQKQILKNTEDSQLGSSIPFSQDKAAHIEIKKLIKNRVLVGHDLKNDLDVLKIEHHAFIDTVALLPHRFGLPFKQKLRQLAMQILSRPIQFFYHDPTEDAQAALDIVVKHISDGRGTIQLIPLSQKEQNKEYQNIWEVLQAVELDKSKILGLFLRGSRALGITIDEDFYKSDWDYIAVYNTKSHINGRLIMLPQYDFSFFDIKSFNGYLKENDISYIEIFDLPKQCQIINQIQKPQINIPMLRESLGYHLNKSKLKLKRFQQQNNPKFYLKRLKVIHMMMRFQDNFLQIIEHGHIVNIKNMNGVWQSFKQKYWQHANQGHEGFMEVFKWAQIQQQKLLSQVRLAYRLPKRTRNRYGDREAIYHQYAQRNNNNIRIHNRRVLHHENHEQNQKNQISQEQKKNQEIKSMERKYFNYKQEEIKQINQIEEKVQAYIHQKRQLMSATNRFRRGNYRSYRHFKSRRIKSQESNCLLPTLTINHKKFQQHAQFFVIQQLRAYGLQRMDQLRIGYQRHRQFNNLVQLHYLQSADFSDPIARQCRGIIVDQNDNYNIVVLPYEKFFDYNDKKFSEVKKINFKTCQLYEKYDGSIAVLYCYRKSWQIASSTRPDGTGRYCFARQQTETSFKDQFWRIFHQKSYIIPFNQDRDKIFIFELMSINHRIVTLREKDSLVLHGVRNMTTLQQESPQRYGKQYQWQIMKPLNEKYKFQNIQQLAEIAQTLDPRIMQGFILKDYNQKQHRNIRVKVKSSSYVRMNWLGQLNQHPGKDIKKYILMEIVLAGQAQTFAQYCPQYAKNITQFTKSIDDLNKEVYSIYTKIKHQLKDNYTQANFAKIVNQHHKKYSAFLFCLLKDQKKYKGKLQQTLNPKKFYEFLQKYIKQKYQ